MGVMYTYSIVVVVDKSNMHTWSVNDNFHIVSENNILLILVKAR